jgi:hypothetical protein
LRVDPAHLHAAAQAQADVATAVAGLRPGESMAHAGAGMAGLMSGDACHALGSIVEEAVSGVHEQLSTHATNLSTAADHYHRMDEQLGERLRRFVE